MLSVMAVFADFIFSLVRGRQLSPRRAGQLVQRGTPKTVLACDYEPREPKASTTSARE